MTRNTALFYIFVGCALEFVAILGKKFYYVTGTVYFGKPAPRWFGRLFFGLIGFGLLVVGFRYFFLGN